MSATTLHPEVLFTRPGADVHAPRWMRHLSPKTATLRQVQVLDDLPEVTVVELAAPETAVEERALLKVIGDRHQNTKGPSKVVLVFRQAKPQPKAQHLRRLLSHFERAVDVEFAVGAKEAALAIEGAYAKILVDRDNAQAPPRPVHSSDPLGEVRSVLAATADLRTGSGRLSAQRVAGVFDVSSAELAKLLGRSRQAVSKTDDAESIQRGLLPFARVARLRAVLSEAEFRSWLNLPNDQLGGRSPRAAIREGQVEAVADLADDMLTGNPI